MNNKIKFEYPNYLQIIFDKLNKNNIKSIIVGGYIRDYLLNISSKDIDVELYGINSFEQLEKILEEFGEVNSVGKSFGVCKLSLKNQEIDFSLPRIDNKISSGHRGFDIIINENLDFKTASSRRDFTINAIGYDVTLKKILDPFNGLDDLKNRTLKAVDINKFIQDPLRVFRAVGFYSRFNLTIDKKLFRICKKMCDDNILDELPQERIFSEIKKIILKSTKPSTGFLLLKNLNALKYLKPLDKLTKENLEKVLKALDKLSEIKTNNNKTNITLSLATLCYKFNIKETEIFLENLTTEKKILKDILSLTQNNFKNYYNDSELLELATKVNIENFLIFSSAVNPTINKEIFKTIKIKAKELNILNKKAPPFLQGRDILACGIEPSNKYKEILSEAYKAQINLKITSHKEAKKWLKNYLAT
ncbi:MAG: CCA tRNA nucleotidyltransferase [Sulfurimonas sp.]|nr:CCA tRNA nucleotidyltransferase [Sulfurimonas sp.]